jgi:hypothetical protein
MPMAEESNPNRPANPGDAGSPKPTIHDAELTSGASGGVNRWLEIDFAVAVLRRQNGHNVVVCGDDLKASRSLAQRIEAAVGPYVRSAPHK